MDTARVVRDTELVLAPGASRQQLARTLNAAYAHGLLSENTLTHRLDLLFGSRLVDPVRLVGDLTTRAPRPQWQAALRALATTVRRIRAASRGEPREKPILLALDWSGGQDELVIGRHPACDVVLTCPSVSRRHARLVFRDGSWILRDLESTNGTTVNDVPVGRCELRPGDHIVLGDDHLEID